MLLYCVQDTMLTLYCQLLNHVMEQLLSSPTTWCAKRPFTINSVTFIDSCQFMLSSFNKLSSNLSKGQFRETRKYLGSFYVQQPNQPQINNVTEGGKEGEVMHINEDYRNYPYQPPRLMSDQQQQFEEDLALMTRKGVYPYEYMDSFEGFQEPQLPPKDAFYSLLTEEDIYETDYTHAQRLFNHFDMADPGGYCNFYMLTDALLLVVVFENFRDVCFQRYGLDPAHNYTSPGLSWQAALKMTDVESDLLTDIDQHLFIEEGIRGGVAMISYQYARANAPGMENYDVSKRNSYIMNLDTNNLYGWAMPQPLPAPNFKWLTYEEMEELDVMMVPDDSSREYILQCDLGKYYFYYLYIYVYFIKFNVLFLCISEYPRDFIKCNLSFLYISEYPHEFHDLHKDYPLAPEHLQIEENISDYKHHLLQDEGFSKPPPKLVPNFLNKTNYIIHYRNLKLYLELGLRLTNVHRVLSFDQSPWLKN